jgi:hypothetical protein
MTSRPNLRITWVLEGAETQTKGIESVFIEIIEEKYPNLRKYMGILLQEAFRTPSRHDQKRMSLHHIIAKKLRVQNKTNTESCKKKMPTFSQKQAYQDCFGLLSRGPETQESTK